MQLAWAFVAGVLAFAIPLAAQERPLGDVARESRANKDKTSRPTKVITNEELGGGTPEPVKATDDPVQVVFKARAALLKDTQHVCRVEANGNSGPGWTDSTLVEVGGADRRHFLQIKNPDRVEYIVIGQRVYAKLGNGSWESSWGQKGVDEAKLAQMLEGMGVSQAMFFGYGPGELKMVRSEAVGGVPALLYEDKIHAGDMDRTISIWVGANDGLPRKTEMQTVTRTWGSAPIVWRETMTCFYGGTISIREPM